MKTQIFALVVLFACAFLCQGCGLIFLPGDLIRDAQIEENTKKGRELLAEGKVKEVAEKYAAVAKLKGSMEDEEKEAFRSIGKAASPALAKLLISADDDRLCMQTLEIMDEIGVADEAVPHMVSYIMSGRKLLPLRKPETHYNPNESVPTTFVGMLIASNRASRDLDEIFGSLKRESMSRHRFHVARLLAKVPSGRIALEKDAVSNDEYLKEVAGYGLDRMWSKYRALFKLRMRSAVASLSSTNKEELSRLQQREDYIVSHTYAHQKDVIGGYKLGDLVLGDPVRESELTSIAIRKRELQENITDKWSTPIPYQNEGEFDPGAFPAFVKILTDDSLQLWTDRYQAGEMMVKLGCPNNYRSEEDVRRLREFLKNPDKDGSMFKGFAVFGLGLLGEKEFISQMGDVLINDKLLAFKNWPSWPNNSEEAVAILGRRGKEFYPVLMKLLDYVKEQDPPEYGFNMRCLMEAVGNTGDKRFIPVLEQMKIKPKAWLLSGSSVIYIDEALEKLKPKS